MKNLLTGVVAAADRVKMLSACFVLIVVIAAVDRLVESDVSIGILYIVPLLLVAAVLPPRAIAVLGIFCAVLREQFGPHPWSAEAPARIAMGLIAFPAAGLFVNEIMRRRRVEADAAEKIERVGAERQQAEQESRALIEGSPAAIFTVNSSGVIEMSNAAAKRLLAFGSESMAGRNVRDFFPLLDDLVKKKGVLSLVRTMVEGSGRRLTGEMFFAHIWVSNFNTPSGPKLTAVVADASEQLRDREEVGLRQLLMSSRIVAGAVSHEIRNLATAACMLHGKIGNAGPVPDFEDFDALGKLLEGMRKLAASDTTASADHALTGVDLRALLRELNIILKSSEAQPNVKMRWDVADPLPRVRADRSGLLQIFLNLAQNSLRALDGAPEAYLAVTAYQLGESVVIRFADNGPGVAAPEALFQPFRTGASSVGLGLYVSRAMIRTYGGELQYIRRGSESRFVIELPAFESVEAAHV